MPTDSPIGPRSAEAPRQPYTISVPGRSKGPLGRGLEDVSHLFLSPAMGEGQTAPCHPAAVRLESSFPPSPSGERITLVRSASPLSRDRLASFLMECDGALEEGLRTIDADVPCHPCGAIDLLGVDRAHQLTIIDFDTTGHDSLLLRGIDHFDWVVQHMPNVARMYREQAVDAGLPPRLVLLAPQFSPLLRRVARQITRPQTRWVRYHMVDASGRAGILFEPSVGE